MEAVEIVFTTTLWAAAIRIASPLIFATLGELICERAGVLNLGIEGIMTAGAFAGWLTVYAGGDLWLGVLVAALAGAAFGLLHGTADGAARAVAACDGHRHHAAGQPASPTTSTAWCFRRSRRRRASRRSSRWRYPGFRTSRSSATTLFRQTPLTYFAFILVAVAAYVLYRTPLGLAFARSAKTRRRSRRRASTSRCCASARSWSAAP